MWNVEVKTIGLDSSYASPTPFFPSTLTNPITYIFIPSIRSKNGRLRVLRDEEPNVITMSSSHVPVAVGVRSYSWISVAGGFLAPSRQEAAAFPPWTGKISPLEFCSWSVGLAYNEEHEFALPVAQSSHPGPQYASYVLKVQPRLRRAAHKDTRCHLSGTCSWSCIPRSYFDRIETNPFEIALNQRHHLYIEREVVEAVGGSNMLVWSALRGEIICLRSISAAFYKLRLVDRMRHNKSCKTAFDPEAGVWSPFFRQIRHEGYAMGVMLK